MEYIISECEDGRYVLQRTSWMERGGLSVLIAPSQDCRSSKECFEAIGYDWLMGDMSPEFTVKVRFKGDPSNSFTH